MQNVIRLLILSIFSGLMFIGCGGDDEETTNPDTIVLTGAEQEIGTSAVAVVDKSILVATSLSSSPSGGSSITPRTITDKIEQIKKDITNAVGDSTCLQLDSTVTSASVTASFDDTCSLEQYGINLSGSIAVSISVENTEITTNFTFTNLSVDGSKPINGTVSIKKTGTNVLETDLNLTVETETITFKGSATVNTNDIVTSGTGSYKDTKDNVNVTVTYTDLKWAYADCYPSGGTIVVSDGKITATITFSSNSASSGDVTVKVGAVEKTIKLDSYGSCPVT